MALQLPDRLTWNPAEASRAVLACHASTVPRMAVPFPMLWLPWYSSVWNPSMESPYLKKRVPSAGWPAVLGLLILKESSSPLMPS